MGVLVVIEVGLLSGPALGVLGLFACWPHPRWPPSQQWLQYRWSIGRWPQAISLKIFRNISGLVRIVMIKLASK